MFEGDCYRVAGGGGGGIDRTPPPILASLHPFPDGLFIDRPKRGEILTHCDKMQRLDILLAKLKSEGHRVLIFSQMTRMLDLLEE